MLIRSPGFLFDHHGVERQALLVDLRTVLGATRFIVTSEGERTEHRLEDSRTFGHHVRLPVTPVVTGTTVSVLATDDEAELGSGQVDVRPARRQTVHLVHHAHQDMGWAERPTTMRERMVGYLDDVRDLVEHTAGWPDAARFRWNVESAYLVKDYEEVRGFEATRDLLALVARGHLEVGALHCGMSTELASSAQLNHLTDIALDLRARHGLRLSTAMLNDVPGWAWTLPSVLSMAGVDRLVWGPDPIRAMTHRSQHAPLYDAVAPDGRSVRVWQGPYAYIEAFPVVYQPHDDLEDLVERLMLRYQEDDYEHRQVLWHVAHDFNRPMIEVAEFVRAWNERWTFPRLRLSVTSDFFDAVERDGTPVPRLEGAFPDAWTDGVGSAVAHAARKRAAARSASRAQRLAAVTQVVDPESQLWAERLKSMFPPLAMRLAKRPWIEYPERELRDIYSGLNTLDEHTWGSVGSSDSFVGSSKAHWLERDLVLSQTQQVASIIELSGMSYLAAEALSEDERGVVVVNPTQWALQGVVEAEVPFEWVEDAEKRLALHDRAGRLCDYEIYGADDESRVARLLVHLPTEVPPFSHRVLAVTEHDEAPVVPTPAATEDEEAAPLRLDNGFVSVGVDPATGRIVSLRREGDDHDFVDAAAGGLFDFSLSLREDEPFDVGEFDEEKLTGRETWRDVVDIGRWMRNGEVLRPDLVRMGRVRRGQVTTSLEFDWVVGDYLRATTRYELRRDSTAVRVTARIKKLRHHPREAAFYGMNFALDEPSFDIEGPGYTFEPGQQLSGSMYDHYTVHRWTRVRDASRQALVVCPDAPLVSCGGQHVDRWLESPRTDGAHLSSYVFNHSWWTNFPNRQLGTMELTYHVEVGDRLSTIECHRLAERSIGTVPALGSVGRYANPSAGGEASYLDFDSDTVEVEELTALGSGQHFRGVRLALRQTSDDEGRARILLRGSRGAARAARKVDLAGASSGAVPCVNGRVEVDLLPYELAIVEIDVERTSRKDFV